MPTHHLPELPPKKSQRWLASGQNGRVRAAATLRAPDGLDGVDIAFGDSTVWRLIPRHNQAVYTVPDLSCDVVWLSGERPVPFARTVQPINTTLDAGQCAVGIRFAPDVVSVEVDPSWSGWSSDVPDRRALLCRAVAEGAIRAERDDRLAAALHLLDQPKVRIPAVAADLNASERQLGRWTLRATGLSPKQLYRHLRLRRFWELDSHLSLAQRSIAAGYYDQAHASAEIMDLTGLSPRRLVALTTSDSSKTEPGTP